MLEPDGPPEPVEPAVEYEVDPDTGLPVPPEVEVDEEGNPVAPTVPLLLLEYPSTHC